MIRLSRVCTFGKCNWNIPVVIQRIVSQPKHLQNLVEFSVHANEKEKSVDTELKKKIFEKNSNNSTQLALDESFQEIKDKYLRDMLEGGLKRKHSFTPNYDVVLKNFFDNLPSYPPPEIIKILKLIADAKSRPIEYIKNICLLLHTHPNWNYTTKDCTDVLFSLGRLSYRDEVLIDIMGKHLKNSKKPVQEDEASKILFSLGELRYRDPELIEILMESLLTTPISVKYSLYCLKAISTLNFSSPKVEKLINFLSKLQETDFARSQDYVNFIWTCVILNKTNLISSQHISKVLLLNFVSRTLCQGMKNPYKWKLLNINAAAKNIPSYKGPLLNDYPQFKVLNMSVREKPSNFLESVHDTLTYIIPQTGYIQCLVNTGAGFSLDIEYSMKANDSKSDKSSHRTGLLLLNYKDICSDGTIAGIPQFKLNILKSLDYKITKLRYSDFNPSEPLSKKIEILRKKLEEKVLEKIKGESEDEKENVKEETEKKFGKKWKKESIFGREKDDAEDFNRKKDELPKFFAKIY